MAMRRNASSSKASWAGSSVASRAPSLLGAGGELLEGPEPASEEGGDLFFDRTRVGVELGCGRDEEAAAGEDAAFEVAEEGFAERFEAGEGRSTASVGRDHVVAEDLGRGLDGGELQLLLGAEVGVEAALAHADVLGEAPDRESLEPFDGREAGGGVEDRAAAAQPVGTRLAGGELLRAELTLDKLARSVVNT